MHDAAINKCIKFFRDKIDMKPRRITSNTHLTYITQPSPSFHGASSRYINSKPTMPLTSPQKLAIPAVLFLISFLAFSSQFLFAYLAPGPPSRRQSLIFNTLVACLLFTYYKSCATNPGFVPKDWVPWDILEDADGYKAQAKASIDGQRSDEKQELHNGRRKWCRKCEVVKPPRTHHCKICGRYYSQRPTLLNHASFPSS